MTHPTSSMSAILKEMSQRLLKDPDVVPSREAATIALMFANFAWNETVGLGAPRDGYRPAWAKVEADNPKLWSELKTNDVNALIDELVQYKNENHGADQRRILLCGIIENRVRVEWVPPAAAGVDTSLEMRLYGLVRMGQREVAIGLLRETLGLTRTEAEMKVAALHAAMGMGAERQPMGGARKRRR
jgi:hypothetical protein